MAESAHFFNSRLLGAVGALFAVRALNLTFGIIIILLPLCAGAQTNFGSVEIGTTNTATATITIRSTATLASITVVTQGGANLDYADAGGGSCTVGTPYNASNTCTVNVTFAPKYAGTRYGAVVLADPSGNAMGSTYLLGAGQGPQITFLATPAPVLANNLSNPDGIAVDASGNVYVADSGAGLYKETLQPGGSYSQTLIGPAAVFPSCVALDGSGNLYITDANGLVYKGVPSNGNYSWSVIAPRFGSLSGIAVDGNGNVYLADFGNGNVYEEVLQANGSYSQTTVASPPNPPYGVAVDGVGNIYVAAYPLNVDEGQQDGLLYKETLQPNGSYVEGTIGSGFYQPTQVALDGSGNAYISTYQIWLFEGNDEWYSWVLKETLQADGSYVQSSLLADPGQYNGVAVDGIVNIYYSYIPRGGVLSPSVFEEAYTSSPPSVGFWTTPEFDLSIDSPHVVAVSNFGNEPLTFSAVSYPTDFPEGSSAATECSKAEPVPPGASCNLTIDFLPIEPLNGNPSVSLNEDVTLTSNTMNASGTVSAQAVWGTETPAVVATPVISPPAGTYNSVQSVTITDATAGATIYYTTDGTTPTANSTPYTGAITVSQSTTIEALGVQAAYIDSAVAAASYNIQLADFSISLAPTSLSISSGKPGETTVTITTMNEFSSTVSFACGGLPAGASCSFSPPTVTLAGGAAASTLTISTSMAGNLAHHKGHLFPAAILAIPLCCLGCNKRRRTRVLVALGVFGLALLVACGGGSSAAIPKQSNVTVIATSGSLQHQAILSITVQ